MKAVWSVIVAFIAGIAGSVLTFVSPQVIRMAGLDFGTHNDRILVGVLLLIIFCVAVYKLLTLVWSFDKPKSKKTKSKKR